MIRCAWKTFFAVALMASCFTGACRKQDKPVSLDLADDLPASETYIVPHPRAKVISQEKVAAFTKSSAGSDILIEKSPNGVSTGYTQTTFAEGDVLVLPVSRDWPQGALRKVMTITDGPSHITLGTTEAKFSEAVSDASVKQSLVLDSALFESVLESADGVVLENSAALPTSAGKVWGLALNLKDFVLSDQDGRRSTRDDQLRLNSQFRSELNATFHLRMKSGQLEEFLFQLDGQELSQFSLAGSVDLPFTQNWPIFRARYKPIVLTVGGFPLVLTPTVTFELNSQIAVTGDVFLSASRESAFRSGLHITSDKVNPVNEYNHTGTHLPPSLQVPKGRTKLGFRIKADLSVYETVGAYAGMRLLSAYETSFARESCYQATAEADTSVGLYLQVLGFKLAQQEKQWPLAEKILGEGPCRAPEVPGSDSRTFAWRYSNVMDDQSTVSPVLEASSQNGILMLMQSDGQSAQLRFAHDGRIVSAWQRASEAKTQAWSALRSLQGGGHLAVGHTARGLVLERTHATGRSLWSFEYHFGKKLFVTAIDEDPRDGAVFLAGYTRPDEGEIQNAFVMKLSAQGDFQWGRVLIGVVGREEVRALRVLTHGDVVLGGSVGMVSGFAGEHSTQTSRTASTLVGWIACVNTDGQLIWSKTLAPGQVVSLTEPIGKKSGDLGILGFEEATTAEGVRRAPWIVRIAPSGSVVMTSQIEAPVSPASLAVSAGGFYLAGTWNNHSHHQNQFDDGWLAAVTDEGDILWSRRYASTQSDGLRVAFVHPDGRLVVGGYELTAPSRPSPVVFNLPSSGDATFSQHSGYVVSDEKTNRRPLALLDLPFQVRSEDLQFQLRQIRLTTDVMISDIRVERIGSRK